MARASSSVRRAVMDIMEGARTEPGTVKVGRGKGRKVAEPAEDYASLSPSKAPFLVTMPPPVVVHAFLEISVVIVFPERGKIMRTEIPGVTVAVPARSIAPVFEVTGLQGTVVAVPCCL